MPTVTYIDARLSANTTKFDAGMQRGQARLQAFGMTAQTVGKASAAAFTALAVRIAAIAAPIVIATKAIRAFSESAERLDRFAKTARSLEISAEALQAFQRHAALSGVETEALTKSLKFFEVAIGKTQTGTESMRKTAGQVFRDLKLDVNELIGLPVEEQFGRVAEALLDMENNQQRLAVGSQLFGRNIVEIMPALFNARDALRESREFAERFGMTLRDLDGSRVEQMNDTWHDVWFVLTGRGGIIDKITIGLAPALTVVAQEMLKLLEVAIDGGKAFDVFVNKGGELSAISELVFFVGEGFKHMALPVMEIHAALQLWQGDLEGAWETQKRILAVTTDFITGASHERFKNRLNEINKELAKPRKPLALIDEDLELGKVDSIAETAAMRFASVSFESPSSAATRGSAAAASQIAQINKQNSGLFKELRDALAKAIDKSGDAVAGAVGVTNTILGDTNNLLRNIEGGILLEPESEI